VYETLINCHTICSSIAKERDSSSSGIVVLGVVVKDYKQMREIE